ncbi:MAG TPA: hypothetical protein VJ787_08995 [Thermoleophilia bacterium]|nr:hypothetical protein [Thermoleophilia bacterium]
MAFETYHVRRQKVRYDSDNADNPLTYQLVSDGAKVTPASATITIYRKSVATALLTAQAMTLSGTLLSYAVDAATTPASWPIESGYRANLAITVAEGDIRTRHFVFDVARFVLELGLTADQLVAIDDSLRGMQWRGGSGFHEVINAFRDTLQVKIEAKVLGDGKLIENMILDSTGVAMAARFGVLAQIFRAKDGYQERVDYYQSEYESLLEAVLNSIQYDKQQDGAEDAALGGLTPVRLTL